MRSRRTIKPPKDVLGIFQRTHARLPSSIPRTIVGGPSIRGMFDGKPFTSRPASSRSRMCRVGHPMVISQEPT